MMRKTTDYAFAGEPFSGNTSDARSEGEIYDELTYLTCQDSGGHWPEIVAGSWSVTQFPLKEEIGSISLGRMCC